MVMDMIISVKNMWLKFDYHFVDKAFDAMGGKDQYM